MKTKKYVVIIVLVSCLTASISNAQDFSLRLDELGKHPSRVFPLAKALINANKISTAGAKQRLDELGKHPSPVYFIYANKISTAVAKQKKLNSNALIVAAAQGDISGVKELLKKKVNINEADEDGNTALMLAARKYRDTDKERVDVVKTLLENGADVNLKNKYGMTALMWAALSGYTETVKVLLENGAKGNINLKDNIHGSTALIFATRNGHTETVKLLIKSGADANLKNDDGKTALDYAKRQNNKDIVNILKAAQKK